MEETITTCPKCGRSGSHPDECLHCGVIFAKLRSRAAAPVEEERPADASTAAARAPRPAAGRRLGPPLVLFVLALGALAAADAFRDHQARADLEQASLATIEAPPPAVARAVEDGETTATARADEVPTAALPVEAAPRAAVVESLAPAQPERFETAGEGLRPGFPARSGDRWYEGADGFLRGMEEAKQDDRALIVYFYTDWCPYCRRLDRDLLSRLTVTEALRPLVKIKINPETGHGERLLADRYGISGYPSLYVHQAGDARSVKIRTMTRDRLKTPSEFADTLARAAGVAR